MIVDIFLYGPANPSVDIILCDPTQLCVSVLPRDDRPPATIETYTVDRIRKRRHEPELVIVAESLYADLVARYGEKGGRQVYFAMEREHRGPFGVGHKYDATQRPLQDVHLPAAPKRRVPLIKPPSAKEI